MKREAMISLSLAAFSLVFFLPKDAQARPGAKVADPPDAALAAGSGEAAQMVAAQAAVSKPLDAKNAQPGQQFQASLRGKVQLKNGPELPRGTVLIGTVASDDKPESGGVKLALRFTEARLKDGKVVPIKATIVGISPPDTPEDEAGNSWSAKTLQFDDIGAVPGGDLHSNIASQNSGVFVSSKKDDVKLPAGCGLSLAIAAAPSNQQSANGGA